ncbi:RHS repeat-associated core domain-containing protein [Pseudoalteromonas sp. SSM20]
MYAYDDLNRLTKVSHYNAQGVAINEFSYELDNTGRRTKLTESTGRASTYSYDNLYRLTSESITDATNGNSQTSFSYDKVGNRLTQTHNTVVTSYVYDDNDRLTSEAEGTDVTTFSYDDNGNTLSKDINGAQTTYRYDMRNRMVAMDATATNNGTQANYQYNIDGIRTSKTVNGQATHYLIDNTTAYAQVIAETDSLGSRLKTYLYGDDLISQTDSTNTTNTFHYDGLGSTRSLSDDSGEQSDTYDYLAFGELQNQTGTTDNNYLYTGEQFDGDLDQYYLRARYYDQGVGRFTQQDAWMGRDGEPVTLNKYLYTHADPVNGIDPSGYMTIGGQVTKGQLINNLVSMNLNQAYRVTLKRGANRLMCAVVEEVTEGAINHGIYMLLDGSGVYTGQSIDIDNRIEEHKKDTNKKINGTIAKFHFPFQRGTKRILEQKMIDLVEEIFGKNRSTNKRKEIAKNPKSKSKKSVSKKLRRILNSLEFCK